MRGFKTWWPGLMLMLLPGTLDNQQCRVCVLEATSDDVPGLLRFWLLDLKGMVCR